MQTQQVLENPMAYTSFSGLVTDVYKLYQEKDYQQAADILEANVGAFPDRKSTIIYWLMNLYAQIKPERAIQLFGEAIDDGFWYAPNALGDEDPDLKPIVRDPEFQRLRSISTERYEAARAVTKPELHVFTNDDTPQPTLIALHGNNSNAEKTAEKWTSIVDDGWLVAVPQSSQISGPNQYVWNDMDTSIAEVKAHYTALKEHDIMEDQVFVGGFSMGGALALRLALDNAIPARGYILVATFLPEVNTLDVSNLSADVRFYIFVGEKEDFSLDNTQKLVEMLRANGNAVHFEIRPEVAHEYPPDFAETLRGMLNFVAV
jgi:predicted esterase